MSMQMQIAAGGYKGKSANKMGVEVRDRDAKTDDRTSRRPQPTPKRYY